MEPDYYTRYPPLGLLKLSAYHLQKGDSTEYHRGRLYPDKRLDKIYVTSLFTWAWRPVWKTVAYYKTQFPDVPLTLGGIYASLLPDHAKRSGANEVHPGLFGKADDFLPDYRLVPEWKSSLMFASRGCIRKCGFCAVPKLEGAPTDLKYSIRHLIYPGHTSVTFFDNDILGMPNWRDLFDELAELGMKVDFNQGLDARLVTDEVAEKISKLRMDAVRMAWDYEGIRPTVERAINILSAHEISRRNMIFYALFNYVDSPEDFFRRVRDLLNWGVVVYPMRFEPLTTLEKNTYIAPKWTSRQVDMVAKARRVIGYGGAFPPYEGLVNKFNKSSSFDEAFELYPLKEERLDLPERMIEQMAEEHEHQR